MVMAEVGQTQPFGLLDLPVEIRAMIFSELLCDDNHHENSDSWYVLDSLHESSELTVGF